MSEATSHRVPGVRRLGRWSLAHPVLASFIAALLLRAVVAALLVVSSGGVLFEDDSTYSGLARAAAEGRTSAWSDYDQFLYNAAATFTLPLTIGYSMFGPHAIIGQMIAALFGAATAGATARLALEVVERRWALVAGGIVALLPSQVLFSSLTLKDSAVWAALACLSVAVAKANRSERGRLAFAGIAVVGSLVLLAHLRIHTLVMASWAVAIAGWAGAARGRLLRGLAGVVIAVVVPWAFGAGLAGEAVATSANRLENIRVANAVGAATAFVGPAEAVDPRDVAAAREQVERLRAELRAAIEAADDEGAGTPQLLDDLERELAQAENRAEALSGDAAAQATTANDPDELVRSSLGHLPKGLSVMLIEPFVWNIDGNSRVGFAATELLVWYPLLALAGYGAITSVRRHRSALLLPAAIGVGVAVMYGLAEGNFGTAYRHRGELSWVVALFATVGLARLTCGWRIDSGSPCIVADERREGGSST